MNLVADRTATKGQNDHFDNLSASVLSWKHLQTVWTQIRPDKTSSLTQIQTGWSSDGVHERIFEKS